MKKIAIVITGALAFVAGTAHAQAVVAPETAVNITATHTHTPRTECTAAPTGGTGWLGQALGGILGAGAGSQVGKGSGQAAAAAAGAVLGAQTGAAIDKSGAGARQRCVQVVDVVHTGYTLSTDRGRAVFVPLSLIQN